MSRKWYSRFLEMTMKPQTLSFMLALLIGCGGPSIEPKGPEDDSTIIITDDDDGTNNNDGRDDGADDDNSSTNNSPDDPPDPTNNNTTDGEDGEDDGDDQNEPGAPRILRFDANVERITEDQSVKFTAVVTDPDGIDDLIGGTLSDADSGSAYGSFSTAAQEGSYSLTLTWDDLSDVELISFSDSERRTFEAEFYDVAGNTVTETLSIELHCHGYSACGSACGWTACQGYCVPEPLDSRDNCGSCGNECAPGAYCDTSGDTPTCACPGREEICNGECTDTWNDPNNCGACGNTCNTRGCTQGFCGCFDDQDCSGGESCAYHKTGFVTSTDSCVLLEDVRMRGGGTEGFVEVDLGRGWVPLCGSSASDDIICQGLVGTNAVSYETRDIADYSGYEPVLDCDGASTLDECGAKLTYSCDGFLYLTCG
jgi:hypothetical protein